MIYKVYLQNLNKQVRTPPVRPADGVVGCVYESFVPGERHRWLEKEILWFCFRRAEPERMISGWTAPSRDSSKTEEGKAHREFRTNSLRTPNEFEAQLSRILPLKGQNPPGTLCLPLPKSYRLSDERPSGYHSLLLRRKMSTVSPSPGRFSPGRKTPQGVSAPSAGLRPLIVSRVKCGGGPCRGHSVLTCAGNTICLQCAFMKELR